MTERENSVQEVPHGFDDPEDIDQQQLKRLRFLFVQAYATKNLKGEDMRALHEELVQDARELYRELFPDDKME